MPAGPVTADGRARVLADGNEIPLLGLGVWQVPDGPECENAVRWALELGYRHVEDQVYRRTAGTGSGAPGLLALEGDDFEAFLEVWRDSWGADDKTDGREEAYRYAAELNDVDPSATRVERVAGPGLLESLFSARSGAGAPGAVTLEPGRSTVCSGAPLVLAHHGELAASCTG